ncbi:hypothetical protein Pcinc_027643 [Petrolisthes cinctipes]|uniref:Uncharacterized protein n=1 Tax=Petrolisthes cinctipes TaxID=88211 RepID=A0AAE1F5K3_PETCI|nr:hypothetical protein Pcinc_027643 [Petrolisthes cinctipes]
MVVMKDTNVIDLSDTEVGAPLVVRTSEPNGSAPPPAAGAALAAAAAAAGPHTNNNISDNLCSGGGGGSGGSSKPDRPTVTFDPNPTIHLTNSGNNLNKPLSMFSFPE